MGESVGVDVFVVDGDAVGVSVGIGDMLKNGAEGVGAGETEGELVFEEFDGAEEGTGYRHHQFD